jgi:hypothetical protein
MIISSLVLSVYYKLMDKFVSMDSSPIDSSGDKSAKVSFLLWIEAFVLKV